MLIQGGPANSGTKQAPKPQPLTPWRCTRGHENQRFYARCAVRGCRDKRP